MKKENLKKISLIVLSSFFWSIPHLEAEEYATDDEYTTDEDQFTTGEKVALGTTAAVGAGLAGFGAKKLYDKRERKRSEGSANEKPESKAQKNPEAGAAGENQSQRDHGAQHNSANGRADHQQAGHIHATNPAAGAHGAHAAHAAHAEQVSKVAGHEAGHSREEATQTDKHPQTRTNTRAQQSQTSLQTDLQNSKIFRKQQEKHLPGKR
jgi:hypothetical protein